MTSVLPPTNSLPSVIPPTSTDISPPSPPSIPSPPSPPSPPSNSSPPPTSLLNRTTDSPPPSTPTIPATPPPQSPPSVVPAAPPPSPPLTVSPPPTTSPPPSPPTSPPPSPPNSPPPSPPTLPPPLSPTVVSSPPPQNPPPSPPVVVSPPPPPPEATPSPPSPKAPPPQIVATPSPPPPVDVPTPPSSNSPPPLVSKPPKSAPPPPSVTHSPPISHSAPPPIKSSPPVSALSPPPSSNPTPFPPPAVFPPAPPSNSSTVGSPNASPFPTIPTEKPTARSTNGTGVSANASSINSGGLNTGGTVAIGVVVGFVVLSLLVMAVWLTQKRKKKRAGPNTGYTMPSPLASSQNSDSAFLRPRPHSPAGLFGSGSRSGLIYSASESGGVGNSKSWFTYEELVHATNGFSAQNLLGEGGFGCVYKGVLTDGREIAVKQLKIGGGQGEREFKAEVEIISRIHHRHLVSLVGYCISEHQRLLVYDYVPNNTLYYHLHGESRPVMDWAVRVKVAAGAARGIAYLHEDCHPRIIHRDIKSSNILLDDKFEARVSDFGLAKLALELDSNTHVSTRVMGTFGYMAPEYATSGKLTEKSDIYSFGVVLLELITGRKPVDASQPLGDESLVEWARPLLTEALEREDFESLVDPRLEKNYVDSEMFRMIEAAAACVRHSAAKRPRMSQVVRALDALDGLSDLNNGMKPGQSEIFNSAQHSAQIRMFQRMAFGSQDHSSEFFNQSQSSWTSREHDDRSSTYIP